MTEPLGDRTIAPPLERVVEIDAPASKVWTLIHDVRRMAEWSPQVESVRLRSGAEDVALGVQFTNRNVDGDLVWITHAEVVRFEPEREIAFRVEENWAVWSFALEELAPDRARLTQRREVPDGVSPLSKELIEGAYGGGEPYRAVMLDGMAETLARIKTAAEG